ncbi:MAG: hypothetical protein Q9187_007675 [Circinaria calcarea]
MPALVPEAMRHNSRAGVLYASPSVVAERAETENEDNIKLSSDTSMEALSYDSKIHGAGVTAILPVQHLSEAYSEIVLTGSYDEYIRVLVPRPNQKWKVAAEQRLGGGVWRLKLLGRESDDSYANVQTRFKVLASCMHAGSRILEVCWHSDRQWTIGVLARFEEHESMNYASDAIRLTDISHNHGQTTTVVSTSFYDKRLCVWTFPGSRSS